MAVERTITQEHFKLLLNWLDADDETAARKYETIRQRLIRLFVGRGCYEAESLTDETIDRVTLKVPSLNGTYVGDPAVYFYGVASKIHLEWLRRQKRAREAAMAEVTVDDLDDERETEYECLEECLTKLAENMRELIVDYYRDEKKARIEHRKQLAQKLGITAGALQIKTSRVRASLLICVRDCAAGQRV